MNIRQSSVEKELERSGQIVITNVGTSMLPMLRENRDLMVIDARYCYSEADDNNEQNRIEVHTPQLSDAVLFKRGEQLVLHRIIGIADNKKRQYIVCGDNQFVPERVNDSQIIGVLEAFIRDGKEISTKDPNYQRYVRRVMHRPMKIRKFIVYAGRLFNAIWGQVKLDKFQNGDRLD